LGCRQGNLDCLDFINLESIPHAAGKAVGDIFALRIKVA
jgi:hypothetical protein